MKSVQLDGVVVCESDIGRKVKESSFCIGAAGLMVSGTVYTIASLHGSRVFTDEGVVLHNGTCKVKWASPPIPPQTIEPNCPRQQAANALREAYAVCEELGMEIEWDGSLLITYQPEEVMY